MEISKNEGTRVPGRQSCSSIESSTSDQYAKVSSKRGNFDTEGMDKIEISMEQMDNMDHPGGLKRDLKLRHMVMIAISGTIGTGLFLTSGTTIAIAGPSGALIAYLVVGICLMFVCQAVGEIATLLPLPGAFTVWGSRFFDDAFTFQLTWLYFLGWALGIPAELSASSMIVQFWLPQGSDFPVWIVPIIIITALVFINLLGVKFYGEAEYWFSILKVVTIVIFIITGILVDTGVVGGTRYGLENWSIDGAPFKGNFKSFLSVLVSVGFAYGGAELACVTAAESRNPHKHVPKAVNTIMIRIGLFYVLSVFFLSCIIPNNDPRLLNTDGTAASAPFTLVFLKAGIHGGADYMNAVIFTSVVSAVNSDFYASTRLILSMAKDGWTPEWFGRTNSQGVPIVAVGITTLFSCISLVTIYAGASSVFDWLVAVIGSSIYLNWVCILFLHFRFRRCWKAQGRSPSELPYTSWGYPYGHYLALFICVFCTISSLYLSIDNKPSASSFQGGLNDSNYITAKNKWARDLLAAWFPWMIATVLYFGYKFAKKTKIVDPLMADLDTGRWVPPLHGPEQEAEKERPMWKNVLSNFV